MVGPARPAPRRVVPVLIVLVLLGSALSLGLALTRPDPRPPADLPGSVPGAYVATPLAGPAGPPITAMLDALPVVLGYDHRELDEGLAAATALMTRPFAKRFTQSFNSSARPEARRLRSVVEAPVRGAGLVRMPGDDVALGLAFVDQVLVQSRARSAGASPRVLSRERVRVRMVLVGEQWKIADIRPV